MITCRHRLEHISTMTIKELRDELAKYPDEIPVLASWEGIYTPISKNKFELINRDYQGQCLTIDVDIQ